MASYSSKAERCIYDISKKLSNSLLNESDKNKIIDYLIENNFINETRFAISFANDKHKLQSWGLIRIRRELKLRKISNENIEKATKELLKENNIDEKLDELLKKKRRLISTDDKQKIYRSLVNYALYRGYSYDQIKSSMYRVFSKK